MQPCPSCQFESPLGAKFCRQCGAPMFSEMPAENDLSGAATRNYGRQQAAFAAAGSAPLPPSIGDVISSDTARYHQHQPPLAPAAPQAFLTPSVSTAPLHRKIRHWRVFAFFLVLLVGIGLGVLFANLRINGEDSSTDPVELARLDAQAAELARQQEMADHIRAAQDQAREAQDRMREAAQHAREIAEQAAASGAAIFPGAPSEAKPLDLSSFEYPGAATANYSRIPGSEMVQMRSKDAFDAIVQHYQKKLGKPLTLKNEADDKSAFFQSNPGQSSPGQSSLPAVFVSIESDDENDGFWKIIITRAPFQFPQFEAPKPPAAAAKP